MNIQRLTAENIHQIASLFDAYRVFYGQESNLQLATQFLTDRLQQHESIIFAAVDGNKCIGFTQLYTPFSSVAMKRAYILNDLFVLEEARQQGIAQQLMETAFTFAEQQDARFVALETGVDNTSAQHLYEKMGMSVDDTMKHYIKYFA